MPEQEPVKLMLWLDMETTGDRPTNHRILEVAWFATDERYHKLGVTHQSKIRQNDQSWKIECIEIVKQMHDTSGLTAELDRYEGNALGFVERNIAHDMNRAESEYVNGTHLAIRSDPITFQWILAGSGVSQLDSQFIQHYLPKVQEKLVYYFDDIGQIRRFMRRHGIVLPDAWVEQVNEAGKTHRAADDIEQHFLEASLWREHLQNMRDVYNERRGVMATQTQDRIFELEHLAQEQRYAIQDLTEKVRRLEQKLDRVDGRVTDLEMKD